MSLKHFKQSVGFLWSWPNFFSYIRILLTPIFLYCAYHDYNTPALILLCIAASTDWIDGYLARAMNQQTDFGQMLDPVADKILLMASYVGFFMMGRVSPLLCLLVVGRDILLIIMALYIKAQKWTFVMRPSRISKVNTALQIALIALMIMHAPNIILIPATLIVMLTTLISGFLYIYSFLSWYNQYKLHS